MDEIQQWIAQQGLSGSDVPSLLSGFAELLIANGIPVARASLALPTVNPSIRATNHTWTRPSGATLHGVSHERDLKSFDASPFGYMLLNGLAKCHWRFNHDGDGEKFTIFEDVMQAGGTDYLARLVPFENATAPALRGVAMSFSAEREGGFLADEVGRIDSAAPLLALAAYRMTLMELTVSVLDTYVGLSAGRRVLSGEIRRGSGTNLQAALLYADLRGFTALTDTAGPHLIARLDEHLEAMAEPVLKNGGEVLKFLGDGLLAAFPTSADGSAAACAAAVRAAQEALALNEGVNRSRPGETSLGLDIALHCGDVYYGNIGAANRLDFTVVGSAVNEASRMEALCRDLHCSLVMSASVAAASPVPVRSLGRHRLRGIAEERELFTV